jgi:hypothetical protein
MCAINLGFIILIFYTISLNRSDVTISLHNSLLITETDSFGIVLFNVCSKLLLITEADSFGIVAIVNSNSLLITETDSLGIVLFNVYSNITEADSFGLVDIVSYLCRYLKQISALNNPINFN